MVQEYYYKSPRPAIFSMAIAQILHLRHTPDVLLVTSDQHCLKAHSLILCLCSRYLYKVISLIRQLGNSGRSGILLPPGMPKKVIAPMLHYIYKGEIIGSIDLLRKLKAVGEFFEIEDLSTLNLDTALTVPTAPPEQEDDNNAAPPVNRQLILDQLVELGCFTLNDGNGPDLLSQAMSYIHAVPINAFIFSSRFYTGEPQQQHRGNSENGRSPLRQSPVESIINNPSFFFAQLGDYTFNPQQQDNTENARSSDVSHQFIDSTSAAPINPSAQQPYPSSYSNDASLSSVPVSTLATCHQYQQLQDDDNDEAGEDISLAAHTDSNNVLRPSVIQCPWRKIHTNERRQTTSESVPSDLREREEPNVDLHEFTEDNTNVRENADNHNDIILEITNVFDDDDHDDYYEELLEDLLVVEENSKEDTLQVDGKVEGNNEEKDIILEHAEVYTDDEGNVVVRIKSAATDEELSNSEEDSSQVDNDVWKNAKGNGIFLENPEVFTNSVEEKDEEYYSMEMASLINNHIRENSDDDAFMQNIDISYNKGNLTIREKDTNEILIVLPIDESAVDENSTEEASQANNDIDDDILFKNPEVFADSEGRIVIREKSPTDEKLLENPDIVEDNPKENASQVDDYVRQENMGSPNLLHLDYEEFDCKLCSQKFYRICDMRSHIKMAHTNYSIFESEDGECHRCPACQETFTSRAAARTHFATRHREGNRVACTFCLKKFTDKIALVRHIKTIHTPMATRNKITNRAFIRVTC